MAIGKWGSNLVGEVMAPFRSLSSGDAINTISRDASLYADTILGGEGAKSSMFGSLPKTAYNYLNKQSPSAGNLKEAAKRAHSFEGGDLNYGAIAGSYMAASTVGRVASGGGIYKDKKGRSNLVGIPFI